MNIRRPPTTTHDLGPYIKWSQYRCPLSHATVEHHTLKMYSYDRTIYE
jgi:hypothetical protein